MSIGILLGKRTWLGILLAFAVTLLLDAVGALLLVKGVLPVSVMTGWSVGSWALGSFAGVRISLRPDCGSLPVALAAALLIYGIVWAVGLSAYDTAGFRLGVTAAVFGGGLLAALLPKRAGKRRNRQGRGKRRK